MYTRLTQQPFWPIIHHLQHILTNFNITTLLKGGLKSYHLNIVQVLKQTYEISWAFQCQTSSIYFIRYFSILFTQICNLNVNFSSITGVFDTFISQSMTMSDDECRNEYDGEQSYPFENWTGNFKLADVDSTYDFLLYLLKNQCSPSYSTA